MTKAWHSTFVVVAALMVVGLLVYYVASTWIWVAYDQRLAREFDHAADLGRLATDGISLAALNDGEWSVACLFGERTTPIADLIERASTGACRRDDSRCVGTADDRGLGPDRACTSSATLVRSVNTGASHECRIGRAGSPCSVTHESRERGPGPQPPQREPVTPYRLGRWTCTGSHGSFPTVERHGLHARSDQSAAYTASSKSP